MRKIFMYIHSFHIGGGAENVFFDVACYLQQKGLAVTVCGLVDEEPSFEKDFLERGIKVYRFSLQKRNLLGKLKLIPELTSILRRESPDIICTWLFPCILTGGIAGRLAGIKHIVANLRGPDLRKKRYKIWLERLLVRHLYSNFIAVSPSVQNVFCRREKYPSAKVTVLENGLDLTLEGSFSQDQRSKLREKYQLANNWVIGSVGRLYPEKNQQLLIQAMACLKNKIPEAKAVLIGDGPQRAKLEELCQHLGVSDNIIFLGWQQQAYKFLPLLDMFVQPSLYEGHPSTILQAWLSKLPVAGNKVSGIKDLICDGKNGLLFSSAQELANIIYNIKQFPEFGRKIAENGYQLVKQKYNKQTMLEDYYRFFSGL